MVVQPIQVNLDNTKSQPSLKQKKVVKPYLDANEKILTNNKVKPLPGQGHLIHDNPISSIKYFFKDIKYDFYVSGTSNIQLIDKIEKVTNGIGYFAELTNGICYIYIVNGSGEKTLFRMTNNFNILIDKA